MTVNHRIVIEFDGRHLKMKHGDDAMIALAMLSLADAELKAKLAGHTDKPPGPMIVPASRARVAYPPPPESK